jgi:hypothetical protein
MSDSPRTADKRMHAGALESKPCGLNFGLPRAHPPQPPTRAAQCDTDSVVRFVCYGILGALFAIVDCQVKNSRKWAHTNVAESDEGLMTPEFKRWE